MSKIVAIIGSLRKGNTHAMVAAACAALPFADVDMIHLGTLKMQMCEGCLTCDADGQCRLYDDMQYIIPRMRDAQGFIFGTPSRWSLLSGELKVFMDRLNPLAERHLLRGKKAIIFAVGQATGNKTYSIQLAADSIRMFCDNARIEIISEVIAQGCLSPDDILTKQPDILKRCQSAAIELHNRLTII
jgi:multimeric flavodoxin WrbA